MIDKKVMPKNSVLHKKVETDATFLYELFRSNPPLVNNKNVRIVCL